MFVLPSDLIEAEAAPTAVERITAYETRIIERANNMNRSDAQPNNLSQHDEGDAQ
jgi:hypothetical protein